MGSSLSSPTESPSLPLPDQASTILPNVTVNNSNKSSKQIDNGDTSLRRKLDDVKEKSLSGMDLVHYKCRRKHKAYQTCITKWYKGEFLEAKSLDQDEVCGESFERYRKCVLKGIRKEIFDKQGLRPPLPDSPLGELEEEETEVTGSTKKNS